MFTVTAHWGISSAQHRFEAKRQPVGLRTGEEKICAHAVSECINLETSVGIVALCFPGGRYSGIPLKATETLCISNLGVTPRSAWACVSVKRNSEKESNPRRNKRSKRVESHKRTKSAAAHVPTHTHTHYRVNVCTQSCLLHYKLNNKSFFRPKRRLFLLLQGRLSSFRSVLLKIALFFLDVLPRAYRVTSWKPPCRL